MLAYNATNYVGRKVHLWPNDTAEKIAEIKAVDDLGWTFEIKNVKSPNCVSSAYKPGDVVFVPHGNANLIFKFI